MVDILKKRMWSDGLVTNHQQFEFPQIALKK